jgi:transposase
VPHFNSILNYLENPELKPILMDMIEASAEPLKAVEHDFAADSTGFSTCRYERWFDHKHGGTRFKRDFVKVHIMCGVKTNIVTAVEIHGQDAADSPLLPTLLDTTQKSFEVREVSGDKGYLSYKNARTIADAGAVPFIAFKKNSSAGDFRKEGVAKTKAWTDMYYYFMFKRDEFLTHYHKRSNVESTFSMMKRKFGDSLRSKTDVAMVNEALCKILCHNIVVLIHEMFELGIEGHSCTTGTRLHNGKSIKAPVVQSPAFLRRGGCAIKMRSILSLRGRGGFQVQKEFWCASRTSTYQPPRPRLRRVHPALERLERRGVKPALTV